MNEQEKKEPGKFKVVFGDTSENKHIDQTYAATLEYMLDKKALQVFKEGCRPAAGPCDLDEICDGINSGCPDDQLVPANVPCGTPSRGTCDPGEVCPGNSTECPTDGQCSYLNCPPQFCRSVSCSPTNRRRTGQQQQSCDCVYADIDYNDFDACKRRRSM